VYTISLNSPSFGWLLNKPPAGYELWIQGFGVAIGNDLSARGLQNPREV